MLQLGESQADGTSHRTLALVGVTSQSFRRSPQRQSCGVMSAFRLYPPQDVSTMLTCGERKALPERDWMWVELPEAASEAFLVFSEASSSSVQSQWQQTGHAVTGDLLM